MLQQTMALSIQKYHTGNLNENKEFNNTKFALQYDGIVTVTFNCYLVRCKLAFSTR